MSKPSPWRAKFDFQGYAEPGGGSVTRRGYLWIGDDTRCYTHTTSLRSLRKLRDLCDALIQARTVQPKKRRASR